MFEQAIVESAGRRRGWSFAFSFAAQILALGLILAIPLVFTYEIPLDAWAATALLTAPPAPPPPAPPPQAKITAAPPAPDRYSEIIRQPAAIPDKVALIDDKGAAPVGLVSAVAGAGMPGGLPGGLAGGVLHGMPSDSFAPPPPLPIRVGGRVQNARLTRRVAPEYPPEAIEAQISGKVELEAVVSFDGAIRDLKLISGHPLLAPAAVEAVRQWRYTPTRLNGQIVEVITNIEVLFNLEIVDEKEWKRRRREERRRALRRGRD